MKVKVGYILLFLQLGIVFLSDFISRFLTYFSHFTQLTFSAIFILIVIYVFNQRINLTSTKFLLLVMTIMAIGIIRNQFFLNLLQLILVASNFLFIFFAHKLETKNLNRILGLILFFCFFQFLFDISFPKDVIDLKDRYSGTFVMANNKSRFLMFIFPLAFLLPSNRYYLGSMGKFFFLVVVSVSIYLGHSMLAVLIFCVSVLFAMFVRSIYHVLIIYLLGVVVLVNVTKSYLESTNSKPYPSIEMNYHRFFHNEHGVAAVYEYGLEKLRDSYFLGVGFGNFSSRSGQIFNSEITQSIPRQRIKFWEPLFDTKAPYGLSSLYVLIVELGILSLFPIMFLLRWFDKLIKKGDFKIRFMAIFLFLIINYNPTFFEFNESLLYFLTLLVTFNLYTINERKNVYQSA